MFKVAKAGDPIRDHVTATWFNHLNKRVFPPQQLPPPTPPNNPIRLRCFPNLPEHDMARFDAVRIVGPVIDYEDIDGDALQYNSLDVEVHPDAIKTNWGILQGPCLVDTPSYVTVLGITWANIEILDEFHGYANINNTTNNLESADIGPAKILAWPESTGKPALIWIKYDPPDLELRIDGLNFQLSRDGGVTWETWATGGLCP